MTIYEHRATITASAGSVSSSTLKVPGGLIRQMIVRANTATTVFTVDIVDDKSVTILNYPPHEGEINDWNMSIPMTGQNTLNITNASPDDTFTVLIRVQE